MKESDAHSDTPPPPIRNMRSGSSGGSEYYASPVIEKNRDLVDYHTPKMDATPIADSQWCSPMTDASFRDDMMDAILNSGWKDPLPNSTRTDENNGSYHTMHNNNNMNRSSKHPYTNLHSSRDSIKSNNSSHGTTRSSSRTSRAPSYGIHAPIHNFNLYRRAFVHRSYTKSPSVENSLNNITISPKPDNCLPLSTKSNERLEFIGDGVLECITKYYLYCRFPKENEGFMTEKKIALVKNEAIGRIALEMGLHRWFILSRHAEEKMTRTNIKKLGCLFEAFLGALFLDCNKVTESDDPDGVVDAGDLCQNGFMCGPGFQFAQIFITHVFDKHIDWVELIQTDDNFKNILQVKIQKEFKNTPEYLHIHPYSAEDGYHMGVYICLGQPIHAWHRGHADSIHINQFPSYQSIHEYVYTHGSVLVFLGEGTHKIKKKAEQIACEMGSTALLSKHSSLQSQIAK